MATATLTDGPAVQLTFPWALPKAEEESTIVAERHSQSAAGGRSRRASRQGGATLEARVTVVRHTTVGPLAEVQPSTAKVEPAAVASAAPVVTTAVVPELGIAAKTSVTECADSLQEALCEDRIGKPFRVGTVMFRLLKRYGITDEEIAEGIATYTAKRSASVQSSTSRLAR